MRRQFFKGNRPNEGEYKDWDLIYTIVDNEDSFEVWKKRNKNVAGWFGVKICSVKKIRNKANYWLAWNGERFSNSKDLDTMKLNRISLFNKVINIFEFNDL